MEHIVSGDGKKNNYNTINIFLPDLRYSTITISTACGCRACIGCFLRCAPSQPHNPKTSLRSVLVLWKRFAHLTLRLISWTALTINEKASTVISNDGAPMGKITPEKIDILVLCAIIQVS